MPLTHGARRRRGRSCKSIDGGRQLRGRLAALGLLPGAELEVIQNSGQGPFVVAVRGSRIVIGRGMAARILVE